MRNDIERAVDTVLSGLTVDPVQQEQLIHHAIHAAAPEPAARRSISISPSRAIVAVLVFVLIMILPLFKPPQKDPFVRYSSEDGQDYFVAGATDPTSSSGAIADPTPLQEGSYQGTSIEEATAVYGTHIPQLTWLPEGASLNFICISVEPSIRIADFFYKEPYITFSVTDHVLGEFGNLWVPQDGEGEYITISTGQVIYVTTNNDIYSLVWEKGYEIYFMSTEASLEDAIRMVESIR